MDFDRRQSNDDDGRIIRFRPRMEPWRGRHWGRASIGNSGPDGSPVADLSKYECPESDEDYRHRMIMNALALAFTCVLIFSGLWLVSMMVHA